MRLDSSGRLLVGTSTARANFSIGGTGYAPQTQFEGGVIQASVVRASSPVIGLAAIDAAASGTSTGNISFFGNDGTNLIRTADITSAVDGTPGTNDMPGRLMFSTTADGGSSPTERMRIGADGRPLFYSSGGGIACGVADGAGTSTELFAGIYSRTGTTTGGTASIIIYSNGNVLNTNNSYGSLSDLKLKENIVDATSQWSDIKAFRIRKYNFKEGQTHTQIGVVANEIELISPGLVTESPDRDEEGNDLGTVTKSVNYSVLYMKAVKALQEAMERIETLEARLTAAGIE